MNYKLKNKETGQEIGVLSEAQLQFLIKEFEEESPDDQDYWIDRSQLEMLRDDGADDALLSMLESAFGDSDELEVTWEKSGV